jgi:hypothetical protein
MAKPFGVKQASAVLEKYRAKGPKEYFERHELIDVLRRLPVELADDLVVAGLVHDIKDRQVDGSSASCLLTSIPSGGVKPNPKRWAAVVVEAIRKFPKDPDAAFYLAALPKKAAAWAEYMERMDRYRAYLGQGVFRWTGEERQEVLGRLAGDSDAVAGAQAAAALSDIDKSVGYWWLLAADGSKASAKPIAGFVKEMRKSPDNADMLANDFAPLLTSPHVKKLGAELQGTVAARNAKAPGIDAASAMGMGVVPHLKFKVGLYGPPGGKKGWPRIRLWVDSTQDPWYDARWNWDELVHWPKAPAGTAPLEELRSFLRFCRDDGGGKRFVSWEFSTPHRGPARDKLVSFVAKELKRLRGP